ncbi:MAG: T9SS type A sorting domain-containing protein [Bacteroidota bacterium]
MIFCFGIAQGQTEVKDRYLPIAPNDQTNPSIARPSNTGFTIVVWEDSRDSGEIRTDIYAQKIDNVNGLPMWLPVDGVPVCRAAYNQRNPRAAYDTLGHVFIVWEDGRVDSLNAAIFAQCLNVSNGSVATNWPSDGYLVCDTAKSERPRIVGAKDGAFIAWIDWRNNSSQDPSQYDRDIYLQYIKSTSPGWPQGGTNQWVSCGKQIHAEPQFDQINVELARDRYWQFAADSTMRDGVVLVYQDKRHESWAYGQPIWSVYTDRFDANGTRTWGDVRCADYNEEQTFPQVVSFGEFHGVGDSTAVVVWQDQRESPTPVESSDIYGQLLSKRYGTILSGQSQGIGVCTATGPQRYPELSVYEKEENPGLSVGYKSRVICVYEDWREYGSRGIDVYCSVLDGTNGNLVNSAGQDGEEICTSSGDQTQARVDNLPGEEDSYIVWREGLTQQGGYDQADIWYQMMDLETMTFSRTGGVGQVVTEVKGEQTTPQVSGPVFVYADRRRQPITYDGTYDWNIFAETPGECVGPTDMGWRDIFADVSPTGDAAAMRFAVDADGNSFVVWEKGGGADGTQDVYIQKLDKDGVPRWPNSGIKLNTSTFASHPDVTRSDSLGGAQAVWHEVSAGGVDQIWYAKISPLGKFTARTHVDSTISGRQPFIVYTPRTPLDSTGVGIKFPAYVAFLWDAGGSTNLALKAGRATGFDAISKYNYNYHPSDLRLAASSTGEVYMVGWETSSQNSRVEVHWTYPGRSTCVDTMFTTNQDVRGADVAADFQNTTYKDGFIVFCADLGSGRDLYGLRLAATTSTVSSLKKLTNAGIYERASQPSLAPDSAFNSLGYGGMLVAWDWEYDMNTTPRHKVQTNKFEYVALGGGTIQWSGVTLDASSPTTALTYPDIARISNQTPALDTMSFIVWEGMTEICSPSRPSEVVGNWVVYNNFGPILRRAQWQSEKQIGPGGGNYVQQRPMIQTSIDNSVNVFWLDGRGPKDLVLGTRTWPKDTVYIIWAKEASEDENPLPENLRLGENYPNPISLSSQTVSHIVVQTDNACNVSIKLYDNLSREIATVHDGPLPAGRNVLPFDVSGLSAGMYHYVLRGGDNIATRGMVIIR